MTGLTESRQLNEEEISLEIVEARDSMLTLRRESRTQFQRTVGYSAAAAFTLGLEIWGVLRGEPVFGWLIPILFSAFAASFWSRLLSVRRGIVTLEASVQCLEMQRQDRVLGTGLDEAAVSGGDI